ncbi:MAG: phosphoribosylformylglycinamidine cyclo-ligase [Ktedonobacteraceae bacterium]|nr:phosphoribosylformylglycinamidine cyclo-ligase [Ktedonobacteraceae bacterium]
MMKRALVLRAPGINCDRETAHACHLAGFDAELVHINQLIREPDQLLAYDFLVLPGGFSYGDDLGAGTLLARNLTIHLGAQLQQFIDEGRPILGICNGFQVLVRASLLPGSVSIPASLTTNASAQFECRWITLNVVPGPCIFTEGITQAITLPVAHGEGQFVLADSGQAATLQVQGQVPLVYNDETYPANPNGSAGNIAGVCNVRGNVLGLMPHPERYARSLQHPQRHGTPGGDGDGLAIFKNAYRYVSTSAKLEHGPRIVGEHCRRALLAGKGSQRGAEEEPKGGPLHIDHQVKPDEAVGTRSMASGGQHAPRAYAESGVNIGAAEQAKKLMRDAVKATQGTRVLAGMGAFAGVFDMSAYQQMRRPALVASTDGVGTKTLLAAQARRFDTIGQDLVNHSVNDLLTQGATPLFFMDYLAMGRLDAVQAALIVSGVAQACQEAGCALLGGETAEMPDVYLPGAFDLAGTIVGVVDAGARIDGGDILPGDILLGLPSSGLHTNGYSLARRVFAPHALATVFPELGEPLVDALLRPHRSYLREIQALREYQHICIKGMAHITGGSFEGNIGRILPANMQAVIETSTWEVPPLFQLLAHLGTIARAEMYRTFNMGIGMVLIVSPETVAQVETILPEVMTIGHIQEPAEAGGHVEDNLYIVSQ